MNIQTVKKNLEQTIAGKEQYLAAVINGLQSAKGAERAALKTTKAMLEINLQELKRILADVEKCCEKATLDSWRENPDRMGGQFTQDEISRSNEWR